MNKKIVWFGLLSIVGSLLCEVAAFVFFFLADWKIGVGYCFVWLADLTSNDAINALLRGFAAGYKGDKISINILPPKE